MQPRPFLLKNNRRSQFNAYQHSGNCHNRRKNNNGCQRTAKVLWTFDIFFVETFFIFFHFYCKSPFSHSFSLIRLIQSSFLQSQLPSSALLPSSYYHWADTGLCGTNPFPHPTVSHLFQLLRLQYKHWFLPVRFLLW